MNSIKFPAFRVRLIASVFLLLIGVLLSVNSSGVLSDIRKTQNITFNEALQSPMTFAKSMDSKMYILLTEGIRATLLNSDQQSSKIRLSRFGMDLNSAETKDLIYLAHTDRFRITYPALNVVLSFVFGSFSFLIINFLSLYTLILLYFRYIGGITLKGMILALMLMASTVPLYSLTFMPELFLYALVTIYFVVLHQQFNDDSKTFLGLRISRQIILIFPIIACLTKPMFVLIFPVLIFVLLKLRKRTPVEVYFNFACMVLFALAWFFSRMNNSTPIEVLGDGSPLKNIYSLGFINKAPQESYMLRVDQLNISSYPEVIFREITAQISKNHNSTIILLIAVIMILWICKAFMDIAFIGAITMGAVMSQAHGQGFGTNLRWLNYVLIVGVFLAAKAWGKPRTHEHELILGA